MIDSPPPPQDQQASFPATMEIKADPTVNPENQPKSKFSAAAGSAPTTASNAPYCAMR